MVAARTTTVAMQVPESSLEELRERGFTVVEGFLDPDELAAAQEALWVEFPRPADYVADPARYERFTQSQFAGLKVGPWRSWDLNRLAFHPDLVDLATRFLGSPDLRLYKTELWAKYGGAIDYDQPHHRDFGNHSLVVPDRAAPATQMTSFILLSDVDADAGPTMVVPVRGRGSDPHLADEAGDGCARRRRGGGHRTGRLAVRLSHRHPPPRLADPPARTRHGSSCSPTTRCGDHAGRARRPGPTTPSIRRSSR